MNQEFDFHSINLFFKASIPCSLLVELFLMFLSNHLNKLLRGKWCIGLLLVINIINATSCHRNLIRNQCCLQSKKCYENCLIIFYCIPLLQKSDYQCNLGKYFLLFVSLNGSHLECKKGKDKLFTSFISCGALVYFF